MKLVKGDRVFTTEDETVITAYKQNGYVEAPVEEPKKKATKSNK